MAYRMVIERIQAMQVNAKSSSPQLVGATKSGTRHFCALMATVGVNTIGGLTVVPVLTLGTNAPYYNNIIATITLTNLSALNKFLRQDIQSAIFSIPPNTPIYAKFSTVAVASEMTVDINLFGFYL